MKGVIYKTGEVGLATVEAEVKVGCDSHVEPSRLRPPGRCIRSLEAKGEAA